MTTSQATQSPGQHWEMLKALGDRLPKDLVVKVGYHQDPGWFNQLISGLVGLDRHSQAARLIEAILAGDVPEVNIRELLSHIVNPYKDEEKEPRFFYPAGYTPNSVGEQVRLLLEAYPWLDVSNVPQLEASWDLSKYPQADGLYVDVNPVALAIKLGIDLGDDWEKFSLLTEAGPLAAQMRVRPNSINYLAGKMDPDRCRLSQPTKEALRLIVQQQQHSDFLVSPGQTGNLYAGKSIQNSRWRIQHATAPAQWPWPAYAGGHCLIGNPHRLKEPKDLIMDCPGDTYRFGAGDDFDDALYFYVNDGGTLYCSVRWIVSPLDFCGSASGFVQ